MRNFEFRWENFRGFADTGWVRFRPITVLIGANSSGKTSLVAPLLLLKQTLSSRDSSVALLTRGELLNVGGPESFFPRNRQPVRFSLRFGKGPARGETVGAMGDEPPRTVTFTFAPSEDRQKVVLQSYEVWDKFDRPLLQRRRRQAGSYSLGKFLTWATDEKDRTSSSRFSRRLRNAINGAKPEHFLFDSTRTLASVFPDDPTESEGDDLEFSSGLFLYLSIVRYVQENTRRLLRDIHYIGPLRERPRRLYEASGELPADVGSKGENAPEIFFRRQDDSLMEDVNEWFSNFGVDGRLECRGLEEGAFSLGLTRGKTFINLADTGFGISQILPLVVEGIYAQKETTIVAEQPEIHLNPALQAELGDFFARLVRLRKAILVETHSEHLVLRLRRLVAEKEIAPDDVALYFVERSRGRSTVREVPIRPNGHIEPTTWPSDFFKEPLKDSLALAAAQGRGTGAGRRRH